MRKKLNQGKQRSTRSITVMYNTIPAAPIDDFKLISGIPFNFSEKATAGKNWIKASKLRELFDNETLSQIHRTTEEKAFSFQ